MIRTPRGTGTSCAEAGVLGVLRHRRMIQAIETIKCCSSSVTRWLVVSSLRLHDESFGPSGGVVGVSGCANAGR